MSRSSRRYGRHAVAGPLAAAGGRSSACARGTPGGVPGFRSGQ